LSGILRVSSKTKAVKRLAKSGNEQITNAPALPSVKSL
jgi:hypothetical protein